MPDFVLAWVDGNDPVWQARKAAYEGRASSDDTPERYRDWDLMRYWFRGVETFAPWVRKVFLVCDQEVPAWLRMDHPKLEIVRHGDYMPREYLPCFSSHPIELNLHRIEGLGERFVYFNDDMFLLRPVKEDFFFRKGLPRDAALLNPIPTTDLKKHGDGGRIFTIPLNNAEYMNRDFDFRACVKAHPGKWLNVRYGSKTLRNLILLSWPRFVGFDEPHMPQAFLKSAFEAAWKQDGDILDATSRRSLRDDRDINQWLIRGRQLAEGQFIPRSPKSGRVFDLNREGEAAARAVSGQEAKMICLNDGPMEREMFVSVREKLQHAFRQILPKASSFEKERPEA